MAKLTFSLDDETVRKLRRMSDRKRKPQSLIVREAIAQYAAQEEMTTPEERARLLAAFDEWAAKLPDRPQEEVDREIAEVRAARRSGGRLHPID